MVHHLCNFRNILHSTLRNRLDGFHVPRPLMATAAAVEGSAGSFWSVQGVEGTQAVKLA